MLGAAKAAIEQNLDGRLAVAVRLGHAEEAARSGARATRVEFEVGLARLDPSNHDALAGANFLLHELDEIDANAAGEIVSGDGALRRGPRADEGGNRAGPIRACRRIER